MLPGTSLNCDSRNGSSHFAFLLVLLLALLFLFACYVVFDLGILGQIISDDLTYISVVILAVFSIILCHSVWRAWILSQQAQLFFSLRNHDGLIARHSKKYRQGVSYAQDYLLDEVIYDERKTYAQGQQTEPETGNEIGGCVQISDSIAAEVLAEKLRGANQIGWFFVGTMIKFGLLGTVIGFAIMLGSVNALDALQVDDIKNLMQQMTQGMRVAMNTTILGLISSMLLGIQYLILDRFADGLISNILEEKVASV